jgi:hypothetical protein
LMSKRKKASQILSSDRSVPFIDQLPYPNPRFTAQQGIFTKAFQGNDIRKYVQSFSRKRPSEILIVKFKIPSKDRDECLRDLHLRNIDHTNLLLDFRNVVDCCNTKLWYRNDDLVSGWGSGSQFIQLNFIVRHKKKHKKRTQDFPVRNTQHVERIKNAVSRTFFIKKAEFSWCWTFRYVWRISNMWIVGSSLLIVHWSSWIPHQCAEWWPAGQPMEKWREKFRVIRKNKTKASLRLEILSTKL